MLSAIGPPGCCVSEYMRQPRSMTAVTVTRASMPASRADTETGRADHDTRAGTCACTPQAAAIVSTVMTASEYVLRMRFLHFREQQKSPSSELRAGSAAGSFMQRVSDQ